MDPYLTRSQCRQEFPRDPYWAPYCFLSTLTTYQLWSAVADDVLLYQVITDAMDYAVLQEAIRLLEDWSITNHLNVSKSVVSPWRPFAKGGVLQIPGLTHFKQCHGRCISLQLVLRPNRSLVYFTGTSMALLAQIPWDNCTSVWFSHTLIMHARFGTLRLLKTEKNGGHANVYL